MADMPELKECPFCGQEPRTEEVSEGIIAGCSDPDCCGYQITTALCIWNTRAHPESKVERIAAFLWQRDYPKGGSMCKTYESTPFHDKELYRKEAVALLGEEE